MLPILLRGFLTACAPLYCLGLEIYLLPYSLGIRKRTLLNCPVLCVGNLTTGGTGKTPMVQALCRNLLAQGKRIVILSRGYGGKNEYGCAVVSDGKQVLLTPEEAGDEAYLLASTLPGVPVVVGKDRRITGKLANERFQPDLIVLDDGMQFWQLHRDLDIVLLNACEPFDNGWTFPRGLLREPPSHLRRAGIIVLTNAHQAGAAQVADVRAQASRLAPNVPLFTADLLPTDLHSFSDRVQYTADWLKGRKIAALSALGNPAAFEATLRTLKAEIVTAFRFRDHQEIQPVDLDRVFVEAYATDAEAVVTTAKDAVKMSPSAATLPFLILNVTMQIDDQETFLMEVQRRIKQD